MKTYNRQDIIQTIQKEINKIDYKIGLLETEKRKLIINQKILNGTFTKANTATLGTQAEPKTTARAKESQ